MTVDIMHVGAAIVSFDVCQLATASLQLVPRAGYFGYKHQQSNQKTQSPAAQLADLDAKIKVRPHYLCFAIYFAEEPDGCVVVGSQTQLHMVDLVVGVDRR